MAANAVSLRYDPYENFKESTSPVGLYARQKWFRQEKDKDWQRAFDNTVASLLEGQLQDGSWNRSFIRTVHRLFSLHLTVRYPTDIINKAIDWLLNQTIQTAEHENFALVDFNGLPFAPGNPHFLHAGLTLFLAAIFGRESNPEVVTLYKKLSQKVLQNPNIWGNYGDINNILRALVVHPLYAQSSATMYIVEGLSKIQDNSGTWADALPFYQTVNGLAHLDLPLAENQLERAFTLLTRTQNEDGTWGNTEKEWNTFLIVHAMRNKNVLK